MHAQKLIHHYDAYNFPLSRWPTNTFLTSIHQKKIKKNEMTITANDDDYDDDEILIFYREVFFSRNNAIMLCHNLLFRRIGINNSDNLQQILLHFINEMNFFFSLDRHFFPMLPREVSSLCFFFCSLLKNFLWFLWISAKYFRRCWSRIFMRLNLNNIFQKKSLIIPTLSVSDKKLSDHCHHSLKFILHSAAAVYISGYGGKKWFLNFHTHTHTRPKI